MRGRYTVFRVRGENGALIEGGRGGGEGGGGREG